MSCPEKGWRAETKKGRNIFCPYVVNWMFVLGFAQTHFIFLSWYKKTKQKKIKADVPSRPAKCLFTKRRKLAFGSDSSTFLTLISHSGYPVSPHRPICFVLCTKSIRNYELWITNFAIKREQSRTCSSYAEREQNVLRSKRITTCSAKQITFKRWIVEAA